MHNLFPKNHFRLHSHKTRAWKPTHTHIKHSRTHTHTHIHYRHHSNTSAAHSRAHILSPTSCFYRGEKKKKMYFPSSISSERVSVVCAQYVLFFFFTSFLLFVRRLLWTHKQCAATYKACPSDSTLPVATRSSVRSKWQRRHKIDAALCINASGMRRGKKK